MSPIMDVQEYNPNHDDKGEFSSGGSGGSGGRERKATAEDKEAADNFAKGLQGEDAKEEAHGIKAGDRVQDRQGMKHKIASVSGNMLHTDRGMMFHATKVSKIS